MADIPRWLFGDEHEDDLGEDVPSDVLARHNPAAARAGRASVAQRAIGAPARPAVPRAIIQLPPPELVQYPGAVDIYGAGTATIANGASATLATVTLPNGIEGVIRSLIFSGNNVVVGLDYSFSVRINLGPVPGFTAVEIPPQNAATGILSLGPDEVLIRIPEGATVAIVAAVVAGGPADLSAQFHGWMYSTELAARFAPVWRI